MTVGPEARKRDTRIAGSRGSRLALIQTELVIGLLRQRWPLIGWETRTLSTHGDEIRDRPLPEIGGQGLFTESIERALERGEVDFAVHSLKDLPIEPAAGLVIPAILPRANPQDVLVSRSGRPLGELPAGSVIGTSSLRRQAQLLAARADLVVRPIRGNVETRIAKVDAGQYDAVVLAAAGVERMGLSARVTELLPPELMLPAPGQGAIAVQCREANAEMVMLLAAIDDPLTRACVTAERSFLEALGGGCSSPVSALAVGAAVTGTAGGAEQQRSASFLIRLRARVSSADGGEVVEVEGEGREPEPLGVELARLAQVKGAGVILVRSGSPASGSPLAGKRVVVTRPEGRGDELCSRLSALGAAALAIPAITVSPLPPSPEVEVALEGLGGFDWVAFASEGAVAPFLDLLDRAPGAREALGGRKIAAVGNATAAALEARDIRVDFRPAEQSGERLAAELPAPAGSRVLLPRAESGSPDLPAGLERRSIRVVEIAVYRTEARPLGAGEVEELSKGFDAVLFSSGSTLRSFLAECEKVFGALDARRRLAGAKVVCIGPSTAAAARELEIHVDRVAAQHSGEGLVEALLAAFGETR